MFRTLETLMDNNKYLCTKKVLQWMEKVITLAMNEFRTEDGKFCFDISLNNKTVKIYVSIFNLR